MLVMVGNAASKPIWKLLAPINKAKDTRNAPVVSEFIASVANPSPITSLKPRFTSASVNVALGFRFIMPLSAPPYLFVSFHNNYKMRQGLYQWLANFSPIGGLIQNGRLLGVW